MAMTVYIYSQMYMNMMLLFRSVHWRASGWSRPTCGVEAACSVFTLETRGSGVRHGVGLPAAEAPPTV